MPGVEAIANTIGDGINIDRIILVGGGASLFKKPIQAILPNHTIQFSSDSVVSNVTGYQYMGNAWVKNNLKTSSAA